MKIVTKIAFVALSIFCFSCKRMHNANCFFNDRGILSIRHSGSIIAFIYVVKAEPGEISSTILLNGETIGEESIKKSLEIFNAFDAGNKPYSWGGVSIPAWEAGTKQYNCEGGLSFWIANGNLVGLKIMPESFTKEIGVDIQINGKPVQDMQSSDFKTLLGCPLKERRYWSEY